MRKIIVSGINLFEGGTLTIFYESLDNICQNLLDDYEVIALVHKKELFEKYGFVGTKNFSKSASGNFWIIIQHADNDIKLQEKILKVMNKEIKKNKMKIIKLANTTHNEMDDNADDEQRKEIQSEILTFLKD